MIEQLSLHCCHLLLLNVGLEKKPCSLSLKLQDITEDCSSYVKSSACWPRGSNEPGCCSGLTRTTSLQAPLCTDEKQQEIQEYFD